MPNDDSKNNVRNLVPTRAEKEKEKKKTGVDLSIYGITNVFKDQEDELVPLSQNDIVKNIYETGRILKVGGCVYGLRDDRDLIKLSEDNELIAWLQKNDKPVHFKTGPGYVSRKEVFIASHWHPDQYEIASRIPLYPVKDNIYYTCDIVPPEKTGALDEIISFLNPRTDFDARLLKALWCTPAWSEGNGRKPFFILQGEGVNTGKSKLLDLLIAFYGGGIELSPNANEDSGGKAIVKLSSNRIVYFDNVKTPNWSNAWLEKAITSPTIQGHQYYVGQTEMPNIYTYAATVNDPNVSADLSSRALVITISKPKVPIGNWENKFRSFLQENRKAILADVAAVIMAPSNSQPPITRFPVWDTTILHKVTGGDARDFILKNQETINCASQDDAEEKVTKKLYSAWRCDNVNTTHIKKIVTSGSPEDYNWWIPSSTLIAWTTKERKYFNQGSGSDGKKLRERLSRFQAWDVEEYRPKINNIRMPRGYLLMSKTVNTSQAYAVSIDQQDDGVCVIGYVLPEKKNRTLAQQDRQDE
jgi:hypothetical protein